MTKYELNCDQKIEVYYWMQLTRTLDEMAVALWKQGRGVGGMFSQRGHEAISVGTGFALAPEDVAAPMHRDLGCYLLRGLTPRRVMANLLARETGFSRGRDANMHGAGDLSLNLIGFISHLPQSVPVALGVAMSFLYRNEPRVCLTYIGDGSTSEGLFHEVMNMAALYHAPLVLIVENNQYAYSTPLSQQMKIPDIARRADGYGMPGLIVDGNDVEVVYGVTKEAVERARQGGGPTLIEAKTMRMMGHAIHDGAEYVPRELLVEWEQRDPVRCYAERLLEQGVLDQAELDEIKHRCQVEVTDAVDYAESSPFPDPATVEEGVYAL
ncbi:MAG: pyruvate dehydrogenase [Chloroflexi bacterium]|nr:MAG: pyruvate dehydrogenase [Chloroflexota bacterium]